MFILHSSNKTENLLAHLIAVMDAAPLASPLSTELFLIQSLGMERWLSQQLASHVKVWANFRFLFPQNFFNTLAHRLNSEPVHPLFERGPMLWRLYTILGNLEPEDDNFSELRYYLSGDNFDLKRYQLAKQVTRLFDQYQIFRPDLLAAWQQDERLYDESAEHWQKALWRSLLSIAGPHHRGVSWQNAAARLQNESLAVGILPERVWVFGLNTMPPLYLALLQSLAEHCQVHLFMLNPSQSYWADLAGKRQLRTDPTPSGHPLLSLLGQQGREFLNLVLEHGRFGLEPASFEAVEAPNNLQHLQNDLLANNIDFKSLTKDGSLSFHACHSRRREIEVLKDLLLNALAADPALELRDIAVMAPDIQIYEPFIAAIFHDIQHAVADRSLRLNNGLLDTFTLFLEVCQSRFGWRGVLDLLERPDIYPVFGLDENALTLIRHWQQETEIRWGQSPAHMRELNLPENHAHTWQNMLERLLMGYAAGHDLDFIGTVLPYKEVEGSAALIQGGLWAFMQLLFEAGRSLQQAKTLSDWSQWLQHYARRLFGQPDTADYQQLSELFTGLAGIGSDLNEAIDARVIMAWLQDRIDEHTSAHGFLRGQLTFCSMLPMRSLPFKVIALIGMNEGEFPKIERAPDFDLIARHFRPGDRSRRTDDRYQFLEILLSARQQLIMTYIGQSVIYNTAISPSVAVSELLQVLADHYGLTDLTVRHPLQPFSRRYFEGNPTLFSYSQDDYRLACALTQPKPAPRLWWPPDYHLAEPLRSSDDDKTVIELNDFFAFFRHPQRFFLRRHLDIQLRAPDDIPEERERFQLSFLDHYAIDHDWIDTLLADRDFPLARLQASGRWLSHGPGELLYLRRLPLLQEFAACIKRKNLGNRLEAIPIDLSIGSYRLVGKLDRCYERGSFYFRYADLKGKDFLNALLHHLVLQQKCMQPTYLLSKDKDLTLPPDYCSEDDLKAWLAIYCHGRSSPHAFFVEAAFDYICRQLISEQSTCTYKSALAWARENIEKMAQKTYEHELRRLYGNTSEGLDWLLDDNFEAYCKNLMLPVWRKINGR